MTFASFQRVGRDLFQRGLVSSHSGNLSLRFGARIVITRHAAMLGHLKADALVETSPEDVSCPVASMDLPIHRSIYRATPASAIVHAHPPHALALSLGRDEIVAEDMEGAVLAPRIPVLAFHEDVNLMAQRVGAALTEARIVIVRGHGSYSAGADLEEALLWTMVLEGSSQIIYLARTLAR